MSLNHVLTKTEPLFYGALSTETTGEEWNSLLTISSQSVLSLAQSGQTYRINYVANVAMSDPAVGGFYVEIPYPDSMRNKIAETQSSPQNFATYGECHILSQTVDLKGHHFYAADSFATFGKERTHFTVIFSSFGKVPATTGNFEMILKVDHTCDFV